jgi:hypothetical protein
MVYLLIYSVQEPNDNQGNNPVSSFVVRDVVTPQEDHGELAAMDVASEQPRVVCIFFNFTTFLLWCDVNAHFFDHPLPRGFG